MRIKESEEMQDEITALYKDYKKLIFHVQNIKESLRKHLELLIFPNDCEYNPYVECKS
ncbi:MAG: hypothetical protein IMZ43_02045 [Thermoplasmata archaeon]|nr:hypothetical protein [Thermoplasmata archaeon]MBE3136164.1 hypothetical protein [Thermoplasmata archaeon]